MELKKRKNVFQTQFMGFGLMAYENIHEKENIVPYENKTIFDEPDEKSDYVVEIKYDANGKKEIQTCYIDP